MMIWENSAPRGNSAIGRSSAERRRPKLFPVSMAMERGVDVGLV